MKVTLAALAFAFATSTSAQYYNKQSDPFYLVLYSDDKSVNGKTLSTCHEGAAINGLCLDKPLADFKTGGPSQFRFNYTADATEPEKGLGKEGLLTNVLVGGNFVVSTALTVRPDPTSNVAHPQLFPGDDAAQQITFDSKNFLNIIGWLDDTKTPPKAEKARGLQRWFACTSYSGGYINQSLNWVYGKGAPQNPSCTKVQVRRSFVKKRSV